MPAEEKLKIFKGKENKYHFKSKDNRHIDIEYKAKHLKFKLHKWDKEASLEVSLDLFEADTHTFIENKIEIEDSKRKIRVYPIDERSTGDFYGDSEDQIQCEDGGLRFELVLKEKPAVNSFTFPVTAKNLRFSYQPKLTQEELDQGARRPLNVEGSYAIYHVSKKDNKYMAGKHSHAYTPIAEDALGNKAWCGLLFNKYIEPTSMTITVPQQFLDEATYPVTIDPDFGYTTIGGSWWNLTNAFAFVNYRVGSAWTMPAPGGTANYLRARIGDPGAATGTCDCKAFINQKDSGGAGTHGQIATQENLACAEAEHWEEFTLAGEALTATVVYILNVMGDYTSHAGKSSYEIRYDNNGAVDSYSEEGAAYDPHESPWTQPADGTTKDYSIYVNYTAAGWTGKISGVVNPAEIAGVAVADIAEVKGVA